MLGIGIGNVAYHIKDLDHVFYVQYDLYRKD
jgi:hypothetical protein